MKKFDVEITETLQRKVSVEAASQEDAERMVTQAWNNQDYVPVSYTHLSFITAHMASKVQPPSCESFFSRCACDRDGDACA